MVWRYLIFDLLIFFDISVFFAIRYADIIEVITALREICPLRNITGHAMRISLKTSVDRESVRFQRRFIRLDAEYFFDICSIGCLLPPTASVYLNGITLNLYGT